MLHSGLIKMGGAKFLTTALSLGFVGLVGSAAGAWVVWYVFKRDHTAKDLEQLQADKQQMQEQLAELQAQMKSTVAATNPPSQKPSFNAAPQVTDNAAKLALLKSIVDENVALQSS